MKISISTPDIAAQSLPQVGGRLDWVGMEDIRCPLKYRLADDSEVLFPARVQVGVSLEEPEARGIHMSRMFQLVQTQLTNQPFGLSSLEELLQKLVPLQEGLSRHSQMRVDFELPLKRPALLSGTEGWRQYPMWFEGQWNGSRATLKVGFEILYSSTCPCSAALAQQLFLQALQKEFGARESLSPHELEMWMKEAGPIATPHAQRSRATVEVTLNPLTRVLEPEMMIDSLEKTLGTPVQTSVKRSDEQEFARLNAKNLMFCEDAARRLKGLLAEDQRFADFLIRVEHQESLHAHNAVATARKDIIESHSHLD